MKLFIPLALSIFIFSCQGQQKINSTPVTETAKPTETMNKQNVSIYSFNYESPLGEQKRMKEHEGKVMLLVNTATQCGLTPQFKGLENLHKTYAPKGLVVLGFPCNQFGGQEPLTDKEMVATCKANHGVTFELTKKIEVNGNGEHPLFGFLKTAQKIEGESNDVRWNFEKFLVNRKGEVIKRFSPQTTPEQITLEIENIL